MTQENRAQEIIKSLQKRPTKTLPSKYFYDARGSKLFDAITKHQDYYIPISEAEILHDSSQELKALFPKKLTLIEYGSGSSIKTRILLDAITQIQQYIPIDISKEHLMESAERLHKKHPNLRIDPLHADYFTLSSTKEIPNLDPQDPYMIYFSGSSIGNFHKAETTEILKKIRNLCKPNGKLLISIDLKKDPQILHKAYNDSSGITAEFNKNILHRLNHDFQTKFNAEDFAHYAFYNIPQSRIEMHLVSLASSEIEIQSERILFKTGESIWTESSYKYSIEEFQELTRGALLHPQRVWTDHKKYFSLHLLSTEEHIT